MNSFSFRDGYVSNLSFAAKPTICCIVSKIAENLCGRQLSMLTMHDTTESPKCVKCGFPGQGCLLRLISITDRSENVPVVCRELFQREFKRKTDSNFESVNASGKPVVRVAAHTAQRELSPRTKPISFRRRAARLQLMTNGAQRITPIPHTSILVQHTGTNNTHARAHHSLWIMEKLVARVFGCARTPNENATHSFECWCPMWLQLFASQYTSATMPYREPAEYANEW